ncbi:sensor histidine kinase [Streptomyces sp. NPDC089919]|uniref:sensor histidine kinase n=1 Tax=Streptomyces sp. NPDC089919 TaxID=3155188 RepID=UPI0034292318
MMQRPQRGDPSWIWLLYGWELLGWAITALLAVVTVFGDVPARQAYGSLALMAVLAAAYGLVRHRRGGGRLRAGYAYLGLLVLVLGALSWSRDGFGALYLVFLPQFVVFADGPRSALAASSLGAAAVSVGGTLREGWSWAALGGNSLSSVGVYAVSALAVLVTPKALELRDERARLRAQLAGARTELAEAQKAQGAAEERERLSREIHDTLAQGFASIVALAAAARSGLAADPERTARQLRSIEQTARENLAEARVLVGAAPAGQVAAGSVAATLRRTLDRFTEDTGLAVVAELAEVDCDQPTRIALLRCTQESLANVRKHAAASTVSVVLARQPGAIELEITDDGRGFTPGAHHGFGLDGMRRRLAEFGGELTVTSSVGDGTRILVLIPSYGAPVPSYGTPPAHPEETT